ncbi:MAG: nucleoside-diphosphate sugar epimerase/dehydratase [Georgfuchsia sp.]
MTNRILILCISGLLLLASVWVGFHRPQVHYPYMVVDTSQNVSIRFLLNRQKSSVECDSAVANIARVILAKCSDCRITQLQCLPELSAEQERQLSRAPLSIPSAQMANGVVLYYSQDPALALAVCHESEHQSAPGVKNNTFFKCYPPDTLRARATDKASLDIDLPEKWQEAAALLLLGAALFLLITVFRIWATPPLTNPYGGFQKIANLPRILKQIILATNDVLLILVSLWLAFSLRLEQFYLPDNNTLWLFVVAPIVAIPVFIRLGLYRAITRYLGLHAAQTVFLSIALYLALFATMAFLLALKIPRSVLVTHGILLLFFIGASRLIARDWFNRLQLRSHASIKERCNVLIYGAGSAGVQLASALEYSRELRPLAFVDDAPELRNNQINGLNVYGPESLQELLTRNNVDEILLAIPSSTRSRRSEIMRLLEPLAVNVRTLPGLDELANGTVKIDDLREVGIEDILGRDPVPADTLLLQKTITGKSVLVTGAGGSIGSELCRQILNLQPKRLVLYERNEFSLYSIEKELLNICRNKNNEPNQECVPELVAILGSATDQTRLERVLNQFKIATVFHAAAYKHVPMVEKNPTEGVYNNIFGTWRAAHAALACGVETFVLISTDKAVRPTNTMGTTKRFAEKILQALAASHPGKTRFTMVRFGNVLDSSGSVVPLFREQIRQGGPITVTDPRIIRYFMTIPEAAQLVIQAGAMGKDGDVFVLDMGEPVKILDLAQRMIHLSGLSIKDENNLDGDIEIVFTGLRPGEKMYEELLIGDNVTETTHPRIMRANEKYLPLEVIQAFIARFEDIRQRNATDELRTVLMESVRDFAPQCGNEDLLAPG